MRGVLLIVVLLCIVLYFLVPKIVQHVATVRNYIFIKVFFHRLGLVATNIARSEGLPLQADIQSRATAIFKDAAQIRPETPEGKLARAQSQKFAGRLTHMKLQVPFRIVDSNVISRATIEMQQSARDTKANVLAMETIIDFDHVPFSQAYLHTWIHTANIFASETARKENLAGVDLTIRATEIFEDAVRVEPKTKEGAMVRAAAQSSAKITAS